MKKTFMFKKVLKVNHLPTNLKLLKTYLLPTLFALELVTSIRPQHIERFAYITSIGLGCKSSKLPDIYDKHPEIRLENIHKKARSRYDKFGVWDLMV